MTKEQALAILGERKRSQDDLLALAEGELDWAQDVAQCPCASSEHEHARLQLEAVRRADAALTLAGR